MDINNLKESQPIEFKSSFDKETIITLAAFANSEGGKLIIGMDDKGRIKGAEINPETEQRYLKKSKIPPIHKSCPASTARKLKEKPF